MCNLLQFHPVRRRRCREAGAAARPFRLASPMSLPHAILTALTERPSTGAGLARRFDRSFGHFWQATHQQIYRELGRLEQAGWIASEAVEQGPGRQRAWRVLPAGRRELRRWVASDLGPRVIRDAFVVRLRAEAALGGNGLEKQIVRKLDEERAMLQHYREIEVRDFSGTGHTRERRLQHLILKSGIRMATQRIELYEEALGILREPPER